jgi:proteasome accessory factor C
MERDEVGARRVDPYHLLFQGGEFYLLGYAHERQAVRVFRLSRLRGKVAYATKAEHDFRRPADFDPRAYANRAEWQLGEERGTAEILLSERIAWQIERHFGRYGEVRPADHEGAEPEDTDHDDAEPEHEGGHRGDRVFGTRYASARMLVSWLLGLGEHARLLGPPELLDEFARRLALIEERHAESPLAAEEEEPAVESAGDRSASALAQAASKPASRAAWRPRSARSASRGW